MALLGSSNNVDVKVSTTADNKGIDDSKRSIGSLGESVGNAAGMFGRMTGAVALGNLAATAFSKTIGMISGSVGDAISRVDTLNNATRTFANMGFDSKQITSSMDAIKASILGMPTALNDAVQSVEMFAASTNDLPKSQKIFAALNDGILGFGGTAAQVQTAVIQLSQGFANGKLMAADWYSMMNAGLGPALNAIAKQMHITTSALKDGLSDGSISVGKFQDALINLDTKGGGGLASLHKIALDSTAGIGTGLANMHTAITRGMADIITAIGPERISAAITQIGKYFETGLKGVASIIKTVLPPLISGIKDVWDLLTTGFTENEAFGGAKMLQPFAKALQDVHIFLRLLYDTVTGGDPTLKQGEERFASIAKTLSGLQFIVETVARIWVTFFGAAIVTVMNTVKFLIPPLQQLWSNISNNLIPALVRMYEILAPVLIPAMKVLGIVLGATIIAAIYLLIAAINFLVSAWTFFANAVSNVVTGVQGGFNALATGVTWLQAHWMEAIGFMIGFFATLPIKIPILMWNTLMSIIGMIGSINWGAVFGAIGNAFVSMWEWVKNAAIGAFNFMKNINWGSLLVNVGRGFANAIIDLLQGAINGALAGIPGKPHVSLPHFAGGIDKFAGGYAVINDGAGGGNGEIVNLPDGSSVIPADKSKQLLSGKGETHVTIGTIVLGNAGAVDRFFTQLDQDAINLGKGLSPSRSIAS